jgi:hypothetical protein
VTGVSGNYVQFGYAGQRTADARASITIADVRWLCQYLTRITDDQLRAALRASGATAEEEASFAASLRARIDQLRAVGVSAVSSGA